MHAQCYKESESICTFFSHSLGKLKCHLNCPAPELFREVQLKLKQTDQWTSASNFRYLNPPLISQPAASYFGLYVNELVYLLAPSETIDDQFYGSYQSVLVRLQHGDATQISLRLFEMNLLTAIGRHVDFNNSADLEKIDAQQRYRYKVGSGFIRDAAGAFTGQLVISAGQLDKNQAGALAVARQCLALEINSALDGQQLVSRQWPFATTR